MGECALTLHIPIEILLVPPLSRIFPEHYLGIVHRIDLDDPSIHPSLSLFTRFFGTLFLENYQSVGDFPFYHQLLAHH